MSRKVGLIWEIPAQEVFEQLPASLQHFLLQISVLQEFTAEFCNSLLGTTRAEELISQVQGRGLFIEERSGEGKPYKIHDLFREYLYQRLCSDHSEEKDDCTGEPQFFVPSWKIMTLRFITIWKESKEAKPLNW